jgi:hypothetical protein
MEISALHDGWAVRTPAESLERKSKGPRKGSNRAGAGRKKGTPNKITADVKAGITQPSACSAPACPASRTASKATSVEPNDRCFGSAARGRPVGRL